MKKFLIVHPAKRKIHIPTDDIVLVEPIVPTKKQLKLFNEREKIGSISLTLTVLDILEKNKGEDVLIFEDDVKFTEHWNEERLKEIADKYRNQIDYINTGVLLRKPSIVKPFEDENLRHCNYYMCSQGVYYLASALEKLKDSFYTYIDRMLHLKTFGVVTYPFMTIQANNKDAIHWSRQNIENKFKESETDQRWLLK